MRSLLSERAGAGKSLARLNRGSQDRIQQFHDRSIRASTVELFTVPRMGIEMLNWKEYRGSLDRRVQELGRLVPEVMMGFEALSDAAESAEKKKHLDAKTIELIALAVAVTTRCDGCIAYHTNAAKQLGITREEIAEALGVAIALNAGAALVYAARTLDAMG